MWIPVSNAEVLKVAEPFDPTVLAPRVVMPSLKVTVPVKGTGACATDTFAVKLIDSPGVAGLGNAVKDVVVSAPSTVSVIAFEVLPAYSVLPP